MEATSVSVAPLRTTRIALREVHPADYSFLYHLAASPEHGYRWRFRSGVPGFEEFIQSLRTGVLVQLIVTTLSDNRPVGLVVCYGADFRNRHAYIGLQGSPEIKSQGLLVEAGSLFMRYLFETYDFEKIYAECPGFTFEAFQSALGDDFVEEGRLTNHERYAGRWWDMHILALTRAAWKRREAVSHSKFASQDATVVSDEARLAQERDRLDRGLMDIDSFCRLLAREMDIDEFMAVADTDLIEDLGFDSIQFLELVEILESLGSLIDDRTVGRIKTVGDAHFELIQRRVSEESPKVEAPRHFPG